MNPIPKSGLYKQYTRTHDHGLKSPEKNHLCLNDKGDNEARAPKGWFIIHDDMDYALKCRACGLELYAIEDAEDALDIIATHIPPPKETELTNVLVKDRYSLFYGNNNSTLITKIKESDIPVATNPLTEDELSSLLLSHPKIITSHQVIHPGDTIYSVQLGWEWGHAWRHEISKTKCKRKKNQNKYYKRSRMRRGDVPIGEVSALHYSIANLVYNHGLGGYVRGTGSTIGTIRAINSQFDGLHSLGMIERVRTLDTYRTAIDYLRHYAHGMSMVSDYANFTGGYSASYRILGSSLLKECQELGFEAPIYKKGARHE